MKNFARNLALATALTAGCSEKPAKVENPRPAETVSQESSLTHEKMSATLRDIREGSITDEKVAALWAAELEVQKTEGKLYIIETIAPLPDGTFHCIMKQVTGYQRTGDHSFTELWDELKRPLHKEKLDGLGVGDTLHLKDVDPVHIETIDGVQVLVPDGEPTGSRKKKNAQN